MQRYETQLQEITNDTNYEITSPYAMGTQEYNEWLDAIHLFCFRHWLTETPAKDVQMALVCPLSSSALIPSASFDLWCQHMCFVPPPFVIPLSHVHLPAGVFILTVQRTNVLLAQGALLVLQPFPFSLVQTECALWASVVQMAPGMTKLALVVPRSWKNVRRVRAGLTCLVRLLGMLMTQPPPPPHPISSVLLCCMFCFMFPHSDMLGKIRGFFDKVRQPERRTG